MICYHFSIAFMHLEYEIKYIFRYSCYQLIISHVISHSYQYYISIHMGALLSTMSLIYDEIPRSNVVVNWKILKNRIV